MDSLGVCVYLRENLRISAGNLLYEGAASDVAFVLPKLFVLNIPLKNPV